jgi:hypothetical protein
MSVETVPQSHLIVTVHGIRTYGHWQERLEALVLAEASDTPIEFVNYKFGYFFRGRFRTSFPTLVCRSSISQ